MTQTCNCSTDTALNDACCGGIGALLDPRFFKALCDARRLAILARLVSLRGPATVSKIAECCPTDISVVSRHLAVLRDAGILAAEKRGKEVYYTVRYTVLAQTLRKLANAFEACSSSPAKEQGEHVSPINTNPGRNEYE